MKPLLSGRMQDIIALTQAGRVVEATDIIQRGLGLAGVRADDLETARRSTPPRSVPNARLLLDVGHAANRSAQDSKQGSAGSHGKTDVRAASFSKHTFADKHIGRLDYRLFVPAGAHAGMPLIVMLHGCTQSAEDFARGTQMNTLAQEMGLLVAYPEQTQAANLQKCWNWFRPGDQARDSGEPAMIAGITREIISSQSADPTRVYVAGLSAGGAAAAIMAATYPDIYAAVGIHSGLACGSARDLPSALAAMRGTAPVRTQRAGGARRAYVPTITFHGENDRTVHPSNSHSIHQAGAGDPKLAVLERCAVDGISAGGQRFRSVKLVDAQGVSWSEHWHVADAGHAWAGGSAEGTFTDPAGPDASREMLRFFLQHAHPTR